MFFIIRKAELTDVLALMPLMNQLGYPLTQQVLNDRVALYIQSPAYGIFVAQQETTLVGLITLAFFEHFVIHKKACRITALIVDEKYRGQGIGQQLIARAEEYAKELGAPIIELTSGVRRAEDGSHEFYKKVGYRNEGSMAKLYLRKELS